MDPSAEWKEVVVVGVEEERYMDEVFRGKWEIAILKGDGGLVVKSRK
jgi:hypothetical protein